MTRILLADDHPLYLEAVRERLKRLMPAAQVIEATTLDEALAAAQAGTDPAADPEAPLCFSLILLDYNMPGVNGPAGVARICAELPNVPVAIMSGVATPEDVQQVIRAGAHGFIPKTLSADQFGAAISLLISGGTYLPTEILKSLMPGGGEDARTESALTTRARDMREILGTLRPREEEVLKYVATGLSNKEIAREMGLAEITVKLHVRQILKKLQLRNRSEAAALATRAGLI